MRQLSAAAAAMLQSNDQTVEHQVTVQLPVYRTNLVLNPSAEYGTLGWSSLAGATFARTTTRSHGAGDYSMLVTWANGAAGQSAGVACSGVQAGEYFTASLWVYVPTGSPAVQLRVTCTDGASTTIYDGDSSTVFDQWQLLTRTTWQPVNNNTTVSVVPLSTPASAGLTVYVDEVLMEVGANNLGAYFDGDNYGDINLVANPSFEQMLLPEWWAPVNCTAAQDNTWSLDGDYSCALDPTAAGGYVYAGGLGGMRSGMVAGRTYTASATVNIPVALVGATASTAGPPVTIGVVYKVGSVFTITSSPAGPVAGGTARLAVTVAIPSTATDAYLVLTNGYDNSAPNIVQWDNVLLRRAATDDDYFPGTRPGLNRWLGTPGNSASQLNVNPYTDVTAAVDSVQVQQQIVTDMPAGTRMVTGYPSVTSTIVLSGLLDPSTENSDAASVFGPYDTSSPTYRGDNLDSRVRTRHGVQPGPGYPTELVNTFLGTIDQCSVDDNTGLVTLTCLDRRNKLRPTVSLPSFAYRSDVLGIAPGLTGGWVVDYLLRQNNLHTSPGPRANCSFYLSGHGSAWPEVYATAYAGAGGAINCSSADDALRDLISGGRTGAPSDYMALMAPGPWGRQLAYSPEVLAANVVTPSLGASGVMNLEGWVYIDGTVLNANNTTCFINWHGDSVADPTFGGNGSLLYWTWAPGDATAVCNFYCNRKAGNSTARRVAIADLAVNTWHHLSLQIKYTGSTTATISVWLDTSSATPATLALTGLPTAGSEVTQVYTDMRWIGYVDSLQTTTETLFTPVRAFNPDAYLDASSNALVATADTSGQDPWAVFQSLGEAEGAVLGFDLQDVFRMRNRANLLAAAPARTVTSSSSLKALGYDTQRSTMANHVTAKVNQLLLSPAQQVWAASSIIKVPKYSTYSTIISTNGYTLTPQAPDTTGTAPAAGKTYWRAARTAAGGIIGGVAVTGGLTVTTTSLSPTSLRLTIKNSNYFDVYMVSDTSHSDVTAGTPYLYIGGQTATPNPAGAVASSVWQPSIDARTEAALQLPDNVWRQDVTSTQVFTDDAVADLARPRPMLTNLSIVADPRLVTPDRVTLVTADGVKLDVVLSSITLTDSPNQYDQALVARTANSPTDWVMGYTGDSELGFTTYV